MPASSPKSRRATTARTTPVVKAVIFLGADAVSMMVAEDTGSAVRVLDVLSQPVELAHDVFHGSCITRDTMDRCV